MIRSGSRLAAVLVLVITAGCGQASTTVTSPSAAGAVISSLNCRLPVGGFVAGAKGKGPGLESDGQPGQKGVGGFVDFPAASYMPASESDRSYVASAKAWLPALPEAIAPDRRAYAVVKPATPSAAAALHQVDIQTGAERLLFEASTGQNLWILRYAASGIFVELMSNGPAYLANRLEVVDPITGSHRTVHGAEPKQGFMYTWQVVSADSVWGQEVAEPHSGSLPFSRVVRLSLKDGSQANWYTATSPLTIVGLDAADHPILNILPMVPTAKPNANLVALDSPNHAVSIKPLGGTYVPGFSLPVSDAHGTWFGSYDGGIWLYTAAGVFAKVASVPAQPGGTGQVYDARAWRSIAGPCT